MPAEILKVEKSLQPEDLAPCASLLRAGGLVVFPTDTVYGLGCDPYNEDAVNRVYKVKGRTSKPFPILTTSLEAARRIVAVSPEAANLASRFWPGALTLVLPKKGNRLDAVALGRKSLAVRVPNNPIALQLCESVGGYLVGTSANPTGKPPPTDVADLDPEIMASVDLVIDSGRTSQTLSSTIVGFEGGKVSILREGALPVEAIMSYVGKVA